MLEERLPPTSVVLQARDAHPFKPTEKEAVEPHQIAPGPWKDQTKGVVLRDHSEIADSSGSSLPLWSTQSLSVATPSSQAS